MPLVTFSAGQVISSANVNSNFGICVLTDTSRTISVTHTYSVTQTFSGGFTTGAAASVTGTFGVSGLTTASAGIALTGSLTIATAASKIVPGATNLSLRNNADSADNVLITDAGNTTVRGQFGVGALIGAVKGAVYDSTKTSTTIGANVILAIGSNGSNADTTLIFTDSVASNSYISAKGGNLYFQPNVAGTSYLQVAPGGVIVTGTLQMATAASQVIPGATSLSLRNNANNADNLLITDAGNVTARGQLACSSAGLVVGGTFVVGPKVTGWGNPTNTFLRTTFDTTTVTLPQLAARVGALISDLWGGHNLIGT